MDEGIRDELRRRLEARIEEKEKKKKEGDEEGDEEECTEELPKKRGRGRPRKVTTFINDEGEFVQKERPKLRKKRGRPKKLSTPSTIERNSQILLEVDSNDDDMFYF